MRVSVLGVIGAAFFGVAPPAAAEITEQWDDGFVVSHSFETAATPLEAYALTGQPARWWSDAHSWSGDADNFSMELRPGGCFCERLSDADNMLDGGARHGTVAMAWPGRRLVVDAALGPMLGLSSAGWLSFDYETLETGGTRVIVTYRVEGHGLGALSGPVDGVIGQQVAALKAALDAED